MDLAAVTEHLPAPGTQWQPGDVWLAGGTWLFSEPLPDVARLLDLTAFGWPALVPSLRRDRTPTPTRRSTSGDRDVAPRRTHS